MITLEPAAPDAVLAAVRAPFLEREASPIDVPVLQPLALLLDLSGEAMRSRLFVVQADGIDEACLRPDFTLPVALAHIASGAGGRAYRYEGKAFRVAPPGSGRSEEFLQIGVEQLGQTGPKAADAELLALAWRAAAAGGRGDLEIELGDVGLFSAFIGSLGLAPSMTARLKRAFAKPGAIRAELTPERPPSGSPEIDIVTWMLAGMPEAEAVAKLEAQWTKEGIEPIGGRTAAEIVHRLAERARERAAPRLTAAQSDLITRFLAVAGPPGDALKAISTLAGEAGADLDAPLAEWSERLTILAAGGTPTDRMRLSTAFGRAFGYYDGFMFEVRSAALGPDQPVAAGGRYDSLLARLAAQSGGARTNLGGAVGCMVRPWRAWAGGQS